MQAQVFAMIVFGLGSVASAQSLRGAYYQYHELAQGKVRSEFEFNGGVSYPTGYWALGHAKAGGFIDPDYTLLTMPSGSACSLLSGGITTNFRPRVLKNQMIAGTLVNFEGEQESADLSVTGASVAGGPFDSDFWEQQFGRASRGAAGGSATTSGVSSNAELLSHYLDRKFYDFFTSAPSPTFIGRDIGHVWAAGDSSGSFTVTGITVPGAGTGSVTIGTVELGVQGRNVLYHEFGDAPTGSMTTADQSAICSANSASMIYEQLRGHAYYRVEVSIPGNATQIFEGFGAVSIAGAAPIRRGAFSGTSAVLADNYQHSTACSTVFNRGAAVSGSMPTQDAYANISDGIVSVPIQVSGALLKDSMGNPIPFTVSAVTTSFIQYGPCSRLLLPVTPPTTPPTGPVRSPAGVSSAHRIALVLGVGSVEGTAAYLPAADNDWDGDVDSSDYLAVMTRPDMLNFPCLADIGTAGGVMAADGTIDNNDYVVFINEYFNNTLIADVGVVGGVRGSDGVLDNNDWIVFINEFFAGCP